MAELHVQEKERSTWPWILAAVLAVAALLWFFSGRGNELGVATTDTTDSTMVGRAPDTELTGSAAGTLDGTAVNEYLQFVDNRASREANMSHDYTADGLRQLAAALNEVGGADSVGGVALQPRIDEIRERADAMQRSSSSTEHALQTREAFTLAASLIAQMRGSEGAGGTTGTSDAWAQGNRESLLQAAMAIEPSRALLDQTERIEQFFARAGDALRQLSDTRR